MEPDADRVACPTCRRSHAVVIGDMEEVGPDAWMSFPREVKCECGRLITSTEINDLLFG